MRTYRRIQTKGFVEEKTRAMRRLFYKVGVCMVLLAFSVAGFRAAAAAPDPLLIQAQKAVQKGIGYLHRVQEKDGSWSH
jgi:hypothetical protein